MKLVSIKAIVVTMFLLSSLNTNAQTTIKKQELQPLPFGAIKPLGWLKEQMQKDMNGFVGHLDLLVPTLINDPIYGTGRLQKNSKAKDLGNLRSGDAAGDDQYKWWNSETRSNWWDGYIRNAILLDDTNAILKVKHYISAILATQDADGYLGIYDTSLRYHFNAENGELWSKTTLYRGLLAYYEYTKDKKVWAAIVKAVNNVMNNYPVNASSPFSSGTNFNGGVSHGLTFTDVLYKMYQFTNDKKYLQYALFLYEDFCQTYQSEKDAQLKNILDTAYKLQGHGVHTFEHLRAIAIAAYYAKDNEQLQKALSIYLERIKNATTITGGAIGDEWISGRQADATQTGYEYCSLQELMNSYTLLLQQTGDMQYAELAEKIFYNAAQGSRNPDHSCIAYLKTDNSFEMMGTKNGEIEAGRSQTRYKYSPAHQDVAVCCAPNAGRITPYFIQASWFKEGENTLVAALLAPTSIETELDHKRITIEENTGYPFKNSFTFKINNESGVRFKLKIKKPAWATTVNTKEKYSEENGYILIDRPFKQKDSIKISFGTVVMVKKDGQNKSYFSYGALVYARSLPAKEQQGKEYAPGFRDWMYLPNDSRYSYVANCQPVYKDGKIILQLRNENTQKVENAELVPLGKTILRQTTF
jgi:DUF1680 family protein